ncbi:hypothetical protein C0Q70_06362 [Pomacea canaliculata]|uniref:Protein YIPF n=1 Tax=Pomacea canaliculata TaxID=400727 RepID=A0A2T7PNT1_POMCA|nr:hypothetical protein C0Q70_06362 [Pomacea canaliculata]
MHKDTLLEVSAPLEGDINAPVTETTDEISTLDEPVRETIMRDLKAVGFKFYHVLYPKQSKLLLREWDLWGPLILCTFMAMMLQGSTNELDQINKSDGGPQFAEVFVIYWVGAAVVTLNCKLLGGSISFFQSVCVLGYCVCPLAIALIICRIILAAATQTTILFVIRFLAVLAGFGWSTFGQGPGFDLAAKGQRRRANRTMAGSNAKRSEQQTRDSGSNRETGANDVRGRPRRTTNVSAAIDGGKLTGESGAGRDPQGLGTTRADAQLLEPPPRLPVVDEDKSAMHWPSMGQLVSIFL